MDDGDAVIEFTKGDMFAFQVDARVNTVNCQGVMGAGVALAFKNRYPEMFEDYRDACRRGLVRPGYLHIWKGPGGGWVINFPTKRDWRDPSRYEDIESGLQALRTYLQEQGAISVAVPALGCGNGGLDWKKVAPMIESNLGDLGARIFVFEPADSRNAGRPINSPPSKEQMEALAVIGFKSYRRPEWENDAKIPASILAKGDPELLERRWTALLPSKDPNEQEMTALGAVARQMSSLQNSSPVGLLYTNRSIERIAELFLDHGVAVVLILPFGPLTRKSVAHITAEAKRSLFLLASVAAPSESWGRPILGQSLKFLRDGALNVLLSDPSPDWLKEETVRSWSNRRMFYLRYGKQSESTRVFLEHAGARPIGRDSNTGEPNLSILLGLGEQLKSRPTESRDTGQGRLSIPLKASSAKQLRELADAIEESPLAEGTVSVAVPIKPETEDIWSRLRQILKPGLSDETRLKKSNSKSDRVREDSLFPE